MKYKKCNGQFERNTFDKLRTIKTSFDGKEYNVRSERSCIDLQKWRLLSPPSWWEMDEIFELQYLTLEIFPYVRWRKGEILLAREENGLKIKQMQFWSGRNTRVCKNEDCSLLHVEWRDGWQHLPVFVCANAKLAWHQQQNLPSSILEN